MSLAVRLAGLWLLWGAWCQICGWGLSALHCLSGWGYLATLPALFAAGSLWLKATAATGTAPEFSRLAKFRRRFSGPLPLIYLGIVALSLVSALLYTPWSFDAASYRLPRILYWWQAHHWYWIGTLDKRLDYSSCGFEWQMLPLLIFTRSDHLIFLLNWLPFLLMPGLVFTAFRTLGIGGPSARRWMWLLPSGFCYALQCSGLQNDGYTVDDTLAFIIFAALAFRLRQMTFLTLALLAVAMLTGAKLSNLPMLLPLGLLLLPALHAVKCFNWKMAVVLFITVGCSFIPLAFLCWKHTGDWTGDPADAYQVRPRSSAGALVANTIVFANDFAQPPIFPLAKKLNPRLKPLNQTPVMQWLHWAQPDFSGIVFGNAAYEGQAGLGCGLGWYLFFLLVGLWFVRPPPVAQTSELPWEWRLAPWAAWFSLMVMLSQIAFTHVTRYGAPFYPLLAVSLLSLPRIAALERRKIADVFAGISMLAVVPVILLTAARPLIPVERLAQYFHRPALQTIAAQYHYWAIMRDDLAPMREHLPPNVTRLGYAAGYRDTPYGLWKPFGTRVIVELGLPLGSCMPPPADLQYAVVTAKGLHERYQMSLAEWLSINRGKVVFEMKRGSSLVASGPVEYDSWYLVQFRR